MQTFLLSRCNWKCVFCRLGSVCYRFAVKSKSEGKKSSYCSYFFSNNSCNRSIAVQLVVRDSYRTYVYNWSICKWKSSSRIYIPHGDAHAKVGSFGCNYFQHYVCRVLCSNYSVRSPCFKRLCADNLSWSCLWNHIIFWGCMLLR